MVASAGLSRVAGREGYSAIWLIIHASAGEGEYAYVKRCKEKVFMYESPVRERNGVTIMMFDT